MDCWLACNNTDDDHCKFLLFKGVSEHRRNRAVNKLTFEAMLWNNFKTFAAYLLKTRFETHDQVLAVTVDDKFAQVEGNTGELNLLRWIQLQVFCDELVAERTIIWGDVRPERSLGVKVHLWRTDFRYCACLVLSSCPFNVEGLWIELLLQGRWFRWLLESTQNFAHACNLLDSLLVPLLLAFSLKFFSHVMIHCKL